MTISIITATYNAEKTIESAIRSISDQNYSDIEYIIVDGGSTDNTLQIIEKYNDQVQHFISEPDKGIYDAINKGISLATGDIIGVLHADDIFYDNDILKRIALEFKQGHYNAVYGDLQYVNAQNTDKVIRYWKSCDFKSSLLKTGWMPPHPTLFVQGEVFNNIGNYSLKYKIAADYDFILRLFSTPGYSFKYIPQVITKMRVGGASNKSIKNIIQKSKEDISALKQNNIGGVSTLIWKNVSKIPQFFKK
ncbi:glycosyltransferase family 2 protein [Plebeiibacterium sediminum]|uniref:Glycosyltransferase n=1 Tax=Plebeiibacterium sediminum TaxID=2992112 RepID=A0AAE3SDV3_9BACT|nr:glycosyltransferase family 2 protein [Plebeiobacterium sediminum]MCW3785461.1 glycosyltransferase [Plebeiobacterium sediminum]